MKFCFVFGVLCINCNLEDAKKKIVSDIVNNGLPYEEIQMIVNNNRLIIKTQKETAKEEYEPSCDCLSPDKSEGLLY